MTYFTNQSVISNADSVLINADGSMSFVKPLEVDWKFTFFLDDIIAQELRDQHPDEVSYAQSRELYIIIFHSCD